MSIALSNPPATLPAATTVHQPTHIPALDGLRGLAILLVLVTHFTVLTPMTAADRAVAAVAEHGWWGVDLFFVLSGFLITGILLDAKGGPNFFRNFYARRTLRIFPLYYAVVFFTLVVLPLVPSPTARDYAALEGNPAWYWLYLSNFDMALEGRFTNRILSVTWSLAIEEQFYLVWPLLVFFLSRRALAVASVVLIVTAVASRTFLLLSPAYNGLMLYMPTPCRTDALALGALLALAWRSPNGLALSRVLALRALPAVAVGLVLVHLIPWEYRGRAMGGTVLFTLVALLFASLLTLTLTTPGLASVFATPALTTLGKYSYALYLLHLPVATILRDRVFPPTAFPKLLGSALPGQLLFYALATAASLALAVLSYHLFEKHFLKLKRHFT